MTEYQRRLLLELQQSSLRGAFAVACDGPDRKPAHDLEKLGYADWKGESWGSSFWGITEAGITALVATES